jgi:hypothetical protein
MTVGAVNVPPPSVTYIIFAYATVHAPTLSAAFFFDTASKILFATEYSSSRCRSN